jgi:hypothetical protein
MIDWTAFTRTAPPLAETGKRLLFRADRGEVAILATVDAAGKPHVAPVSPIFCGDGVYLSVGPHTPKARHLAANGRYALHALVGADDLEFQMSGAARKVTTASERDAVVSAIPFPSFDPSDPIFELLIDHAVVVTWPERTPRGKKLVWSA